jgi:hypothetical protein
VARVSFWDDGFDRWRRLRRSEDEIRRVLARPAVRAVRRLKGEAAPSLQSASDRLRRSTGPNPILPENLAGAAEGFCPNNSGLNIRLGALNLALLHGRLRGHSVREMEFHRQRGHRALRGLGDRRTVTRRDGCSLPGPNEVPRGPGTRPRARPEHPTASSAPIVWTSLPPRRCLRTAGNRQRIRRWEMAVRCNPVTDTTEAIMPENGLSRGRPQSRPSGVDSAGLRGLPRP